MSQLDLGFAHEAPRGLSWRRHPYPHVPSRADYELVGAGIWVRWCGHPTALRPYTVRLPDGSNLDIYNGDHDPSGLPFTTFYSVAEAKLAAEQWRNRHVS